MAKIRPDSQMVTLNAHIQEAINLQRESSNAYIAIGRKSSWTDDENPPDEKEDTEELDELYGYKKVDKFSLARPLKENENEKDVSYPTVKYGTDTWVLVPNDEAFKEKARWVYISAQISPEDFETGMYRQVGFHIKLEPNKDINKKNLTPSEVKDKGVLYFYENREPQNRTSSVYAQEEFIIKV